MNNYFRILLISLLTISIQSCMTTAQLSDFSRTSDGLDFNEIAISKNDTTDAEWNGRTEFEYYIKTVVTVDSLIIKAIKSGLNSEKFSIKLNSKNNCTILGERGMTFNEYNSIAGVYYQINSASSEIYINCKITQDMTGGWREDRAKKIGLKICKLLNGCEQSYSVRTRWKK